MTALADVLVLHQWSANSCWQCKCGKSWPCGPRDEWMAKHQAEMVAAAGLAVIKLPEVGYKGPHDTDAGFFDLLAERLDAGMDPGGSGVRRAGARILRQAAAAAREMGR